MPEGVQVAISGVDVTGPAFASAQARMQGFQTAISGSTGSFRESHAAARLFSEELGLHLNREMTNIISRSELLKGALSAALPLAGAIGFLEIAGRIPDAIAKMSDSLMGFDETAKKAMASAISANEEYYKHFKTVTEGYALLATMHKEQERLQSQSDVPSAPNSWAKNLLGPAGGVWDVASTWMKNAEERKKALATLDANALSVVQHTGEVYKKNREELEKAAKAAERIAAAGQRAAVAWDMMWNKARKAQTEAAPGQRLFDNAQLSGDFRAPGWMAGLSSAQTSPLYSGSNAAMQLAQIQADQNSAIAAAQGIYEQTRSKAQAYSDQIAILTELLNQGRINQEQFSTAALQASSQMDKNSRAWARFSDETEKSLLDAAFMKRSWSDALKTILEDLTKVILKMYLLNAIKKQFNQDDSGSSSGGGGGFLKMLGSFFGGGASGGGGGGEGDFLPLASGGPAYSGMSYLVGERGPELFSPRTSGSITPNGRFGGVTHQHFYDLRGADVGVEQRLLRLFPIVEERAVQRSIATVQERNLRR